VVRRGDKPQKLQVERLTQAFKDALANYAAVQKVRLCFMSHYTSTSRLR
jgi:hypothetical protein